MQVVMAVIVGLTWTQGNIRGDSYDRRADLL